MAPDERGGRDLLGEWRRLMDSLVTSMTTPSGRASLPRELLAAMQGQLALEELLCELELALHCSEQLTRKRGAPGGGCHRVDEGFHQAPPLPEQVAPAALIRSHQTPALAARSALT